MTNLIFPFSEYWSFYLLFTAFIVSLLLLDLGLLQRRDQEITIPQALAWTGMWVALALVFNGLLYLFVREMLVARGVGEPRASSEALRIALEFLTGYLVEKALSVDNIFVFIVIFNFFATPAKYQHKVLFLGILGALVFRGIFIATGAAVLDYHWVIVAFGVFLVYTGIKTITADDDIVDPSQNTVLKFLKRRLPVTDEYRGRRMVVRHNGKFLATPLLVTLIVIECTDIVFAVDSVPAIFGITREPLIVFTSNMFAILGLRALYFVLAGMMSKFHLLRYGLGVVLAFVGVKMAALDWLLEDKFPITWSLAIVLGCISLSVALSLLLPQPLENEETSA